MHRKSNSCFCAAFPLAVVACVSLVIVAGIVIWMAAQEGTGPGELLANMLQRQRPARPVLPQNTPLPTVTFYPSPTPIPVAIVTPQVPAAEVMPPTQPIQPPVTEALPGSSTVGTPAPTPPETSPQVVPAPQPETAIESPIRPSSPLPERPATRIVIPTMDLDAPVTMSPIVNQTWKVDHLGTELVGHLEGTASPGDPSNVVLAGHVTVAHNVYGPFAGLGQLKEGDSIILYVGSQAYTYIVDYRQLVDRTDVQIAYPTDTARVTLITCSNWSDEMGAYQQRLIVVGHLAGEGS
jgi:LPXTG-site transpeptidase (sortase) family protein